GGASGSVNVLAPAGCPWSANSNSGFIRITSNPGGSGNGSIAYSVDPNTKAGGRNGSLTIAGLTFPVTQAGQGCLVGLNPCSASLGSGASATSGALSLPGSDCQWTAASSVPAWLTVAPGSGSGTGNGTINYSVSSNAGSSTARSAAINI